MSGFRRWGFIWTSQSLSFTCGKEKHVGSVMNQGCARLRATQRSLLNIRLREGGVCLRLPFQQSSDRLGWCQDKKGIQRLDLAWHCELMEQMV